MKPYIFLNIKKLLGFLLLSVFILLPEIGYSVVNCNSGPYHDPLTSLTVGNSSFTDSICVGYYQQYRFSVTSGREYKITVSPFMTSDPDLYLHNSSNVSPSNYSYSSVTRGNLTETYTFTAPATGYYYAAVNGYSVSSGNEVNYTIKVEEVSPPDPPNLLSPSIGATIIVGQNIIFSWSSSAGAGRYRLKICTDQAMTNQIADSPFEPNPGVTSQLVSASHFSADQTYYWQVGAIAPGDVGDWGDYGPSSAWTFTTILPSELNLITPGSDTTVNEKAIIFSWSDVEADRYELYVDNNSGMGSPEISKYSIDVLNNYSGTSYELTDIWLPEGIYYWKVYAFFSDGSSVESPVYSFTYLPPKASAPVWVPLYRLYKNDINDHYYTTITIVDPKNATMC